LATGDDQIKIGLGIAFGEKVFDPTFKNSSEGEGERQARAVFANLNCIDGLSRHTQLLAQFLLAPAFFGSPGSNTIPHL